MLGRQRPKFPRNKDGAPNEVARLPYGEHGGNCRPATGRICPLFGDLCIRDGDYDIRVWGAQASLSTQGAINTLLLSSALGFNALRFRPRQRCPLALWSIWIGASFLLTPFLFRVPIRIQLGEPRLRR